MFYRILWRGRMVGLFCHCHWIEPPSCILLNQFQVKKRQICIQIVEWMTEWANTPKCCWPASLTSFCFCISQRCKYVLWMFTKLSIISFILCLPLFLAVLYTGEIMGDLQIKDRKKRFTSFPSPDGMSLTKLPLGRNNSVMTSLFPPTLKKISVMHVIKLGFAPVSFPPG